MDTYIVKLRHHSAEEFETVRANSYITSYDGKGFVTFRNRVYEYYPVELKRGVWPFGRTETLYRRDFTESFVAEFSAGEVLWVEKL